MESSGKLKEEDKCPPSDGLEYYISSYYELSSCRGQNGHIEFVAIKEYYEVFPVGSFEEFLTIIRMMDHKLLELENGTKSDKGHSSKDTGKGK